MSDETQTAIDIFLIIGCLTDINGWLAGWFWLTDVFVYQMDGVVVPLVWYDALN